MAAHRMSARLSGASQEQLLEFIDEQAPLWSAAAMRVAEEHAARLVEQPEWILSEVLLSPDLAPHILAQLPTTEHAVKGTCRAWRRGWKETLKKRERARLLVIGGCIEPENEFISSLERYDAAENVWEEEEAVAPMPTARLAVGTEVLDGKLYAVGGLSDADGAASNLVERYDLATKSWETVAPLARARKYHRLAVLDGKLYAVGGYDNDGFVHHSSVERYDPALNVWEAVAPMVAARMSLGVAVLDGKLYAVGGFSRENGGHLSSVERYDPATNAWEAVAPMGTARLLLAVAVLDGKLYAVGGLNDYHDHLSSVERYDPGTDAWEAVAPLTLARFGAGVAALEGKLYAVGGRVVEEEEVVPMEEYSVERFDPATNAWEEVVPMATARAYPFALLM